jgi:pSer/pThr/pTyr-binding forkhead associated (FHA) protein
MKHPPVIVVQLVHIAGPKKGQIETFSEGTISIGRNPTCNLCFPPDFTGISRNHADIVRDGNQFKLIDHSTNGTFVNGKQVTEAYLKNGDILEFSQGGPKVSFLTEVQDVSIESAKPLPSSQKEVPVERPVQEIPKRLIRPAQEKPEEPSAQVTSTSLIIQYGPTIRSFNKMPVTIGRNPTCEFALDLPAILNIHAQIFYSQNQYWIKDLTSQRSVSINRQPIGLQAPFAINDEIALSPNGPVFRVVGEGRLAEVEEPLAEKSLTRPRQQEPETKEPEGLLPKVKKYLREKLR